MVLEREFQRVSISGEEKCGVSVGLGLESLAGSSLVGWDQSGLVVPGVEDFRRWGQCGEGYREQVSTSGSGTKESDYTSSSPGAIHRPAGCSQECGAGTVHPGEVHDPVAAEFLPHHPPLPAAAGREAPGNTDL